MMHRTRTDFDFWGRKYGTHTTPLQEQLAPPDDCRNCLNQHVLSYTYAYEWTYADPQHPRLTGEIKGYYRCPECGYEWTQTWQIQAVSEPADRMPT